MAKQNTWNLAIGIRNPKRLPKGKTPMPDILVTTATMSIMNEQSQPNNKTETLTQGYKKGQSSNEHNTDIITPPMPTRPNKIKLTHDELLAMMAIGPDWLKEISLALTAPSKQQKEQEETRERSVEYDKGRTTGNGRQTPDGPCSTRRGEYRTPLEECMCATPRFTRSSDRPLSSRLSERQQDNWKYRRTSIPRGETFRTRYETSEDTKAAMKAKEEKEFADYIAERDRAAKAHMEQARKIQIPGFSDRILDLDDDEEFVSDGEGGKIGY